MATSATEEPGKNLEAVVDVLAAACAQHPASISVADIQAALGERSFGPLLLVPGLIGLSPIGAIPGLPAITSVIVFLVAGQILLGQHHFWLPGGIRRRSINGARLARALQILRPWARVVDRFLLRRYSALTRGPFLYVLSALCLLVAAVTPIIEVVPLAGIVPNAAIVAIALAITAEDGLWALFAFAFAGATIELLAAML